MSFPKTIPITVQWRYDKRAKLASLVVTKLEITLYRIRKEKNIWKAFSYYPPVEESFKTREAAMLFVEKFLKIDDRKGSRDD
jgi:hypothetical protein